MTRTVVAADAPAPPAPPEVPAGTAPAGSDGTGPDGTAEGGSTALRLAESVLRAAADHWKITLAIFLYLAATIGSALDHHRGRGVVWKSRAYRGADA